MTDRELLEKAAKAAGMFVLPEPWPNKSGWFYCLQHEHPAMHYRDLSSARPQAAAWNPLTDDGDALRLSIATKQNIGMYESARDGVHQARAGRWGEVVEPVSVDEAAAMRRAIVRAAAAMADEKAST